MNLKVVLFVILMTPGLVYSGVVADKTRVIINESKPYNTLKLFNNAEFPSIIQVFIAESNDKKNKKFIETSDIHISPPIFKIESHESQEVKIRYVGIPLPKETEKIYYLHIIQTPPLTGDAVKNQLVITQRHIIKLFVRSGDLQNLSSSDFDNAKFVLTKTSEGNILNFYNESFFHLNIISVKSDVQPFINSTQLCEESFSSIGMNNIMVSPGEHYKSYVDKDFDINELSNQCRMVVKIVAEHGGVVTKLVSIGVE